MSEKNITVNQMINEVVEELTAENPERVMSYGEIIQKVHEKFGEKNRNTLQCHIIMKTVNIPARVHYGKMKPRIIDQATERDLLYSVDPGKVVKYDPEKHGVWEIRQENETGKWMIGEVTAVQSSAVTAVSTAESSSGAFALESHLRDYLAKNLGALSIHGKTLALVRMEYSTGVGPIDILAKDAEGNFYVFELKCSRGTDKALGQILRYMGWIQDVEAEGKKVFGIIVAEKMDEKLRYAVKMVKDIELFEYEMKFLLKTLES